MCRPLIQTKGGNAENESLVFMKLLDTEVFTGMGHWKWHGCPTGRGLFS